MLKQRFFALMLTAIGIASAVIENDATAAQMLVPFGLYALITRERIIM